MRSVVVAGIGAALSLSSFAPSSSSSSSSPLVVVDGFAPAVPVPNRPRVRPEHQDRPLQTESFIERAGTASLASTMTETASEGTTTKTKSDNKLFFCDDPKGEDADDPQSFIRDTLQSSFVFDCLKPDELDSLVSAFTRQTVPAGTDICTRGEPGDDFYIIQSGQVKFFVGGEEVGTAGEGQSFGELALLFDRPRAATATAHGDDVTLWRVDRKTFRTFYEAPNYSKTDEEADFVREALKFDRIFDSLDLQPSEVETLVSAFEKRTAAAETDICTQGEWGDYFYIIQDGLVKFFVDGNEVGMAGEQQSFGELALLFDSPRAATATAFAGDVTLWRVDRSTFRAVLGSQTLSNLDTYSSRVKLKKQLEDAAILGFSEELPENYCEDIMAQLEELRPIARPAYHCSMNGDWCMVKAGSSTIDMALIEILSKLSQILPFLDFQDVYITLSDNASLVTCNIFLQLFGVLPIKVNAFTSMDNDDDHPEGIRMFELFEGSRVLGIDFKPPPGLIQARPLDITFLDGDIMIARNPNSGGDPHLLVRIRSSPDEDPDHEYTGFFEKARLLYGDKITRCLVDRQLGSAKVSDIDLSSLLDADREKTQKA